jgi:hypothetical protein
MSPSTGAVSITAPVDVFLGTARVPSEAADTLK